MMTLPGLLLIGFVVCNHFAPADSALLQIAVLMQGSDFINSSVVPQFGVNQFDLGDVYISPCRAGMFNDRRDWVCKDCAVCAAHQFEKAKCLAIQNRVCANCSTCTANEREACECGARTVACYTGDRVCLPSVGISVNISFSVFTSGELSGLQELFLSNGMSTGFILFLSAYIGISGNDLTLRSVTKRTQTRYQVTYVARNVYSAESKSKIASMDEAVVQRGLASTFGIQFGTRRRLLQIPGGIQLFGQELSKEVVSAEPCGTFFYMSDPLHPFNSTCLPEPCPPGFSGDFGKCVACPNATYKSTTGNDTCTACPPAYTSNQGSTDLTQCWPQPVVVPETTLSHSSPPTSGGVSSGAGTTTSSTTGGSITSASNPQTGGTSTSVSQTASSTGRPVLTSTTNPPVQTSSSTAPIVITTVQVMQTSAAPVIPTEPPVRTVVAGGSSSTYYHYVRSGFVQYITINENGGGWSVGPVTGAMGLFFVSILLFGSRVFAQTGRGAANRRNYYYTRIPSARREIPVAIVVPSVTDPTSPEDQKGDQTSRLHDH